MASVTKGSIRKWFDGLKARLTVMGSFEVLSDLSYVYNVDETNIRLCSKSTKVVAIKMWKNIYRVCPGIEKEVCGLCYIFR